MKKLFSLAVLSCTFFSMSAFATVPASPCNVVYKAPLSISWPVTGSISGTTQGTVSYSISGSGNTPSYISFYQLNGTLIGTYSFSPQSGVTGVYIATGMSAALGITGVRMGIYSDGSGYTLDFFGLP